MVVTQRLAQRRAARRRDAELAPDDTPLGEIYQFRARRATGTTSTSCAPSWSGTSRACCARSPGVADVVAFGGYLKEIHVEVDPDRGSRARPDARGRRATRSSKSNLNVGGGFLRHGDQELDDPRRSATSSPPRTSKTIVLRRPSDGTPVTVGDVASVDARRTRRGAASVGCNDEREVVEGFVAAAPRREPVARARRRARRRSTSSNDKILPKGMKIEPFYDRTDLVEPHARHGAPQPVCTASCSSSPSSGCSCAACGGSLIVAVVIPLALLVAFIGLYVDRAAGEPDLDGRDRLRHPRRRRGGAGRERDARDAHHERPRDAARRCSRSSSARRSTWRGRRSSRWRSSSPR